MAGMAIPMRVDYTQKSSELLEEIKESLLKQGKSNKEIEQTLKQSSKDIELQKDLSAINDKIEVYPKFMQKSLAQQKKLVQLEIESSARDQTIQNLQDAGRITKFEARQIRFKERLNKVYEKWIVKGNFFKTVLGGIKDIAKGIYNKASSWIFSLLKLLLILSIFDPKGKFLQSILGFITRMVVLLINLIAKHLPRIVKTFVFLLTEVLPAALKKMIAMIFPAIGNMFYTFAKELKAKYPIISWIFNKIGDMFQKDGVLYKFFMFLADKFPIIVGLFVGAKLLSKLSFLSSILGPAGTLVTGMGKLFLAMGPAGWLIMGIAAIGVAAYNFYKNAEENTKKYKENLKQFNITGKETKEQKSMKKINRSAFMLQNKFGMASELMAAFKQGGFKKVKETFRQQREMFGEGKAEANAKNMAYLKKNLFDPLTKFFTKTVPGFFKNIFSKSIPNAITSALNIIKDKVSSLWSGMKSVGTGVKDTVVDAGKGLKNLGSDVINGIVNGLTRFWKFLKESFLGGLDNIRKGIEMVGNYFNAIAKNPIAFLGMTAGARDKWQRAILQETKSSEYNRRLKAGENLASEKDYFAQLAKAKQAGLLTEIDYNRMINKFIESGDQGSDKIVQAIKESVAYRTSQSTAIVVGRSIGVKLD